MLSNHFLLAGIWRLGVAFNTPGVLKSEWVETEVEFEVEVEVHGEVWSSPSHRAHSDFGVAPSPRGLTEIAMAPKKRAKCAAQEASSLYFFSKEIPS